MIHKSESARGGTVSGARANCEVDIEGSKKQQEVWRCLQDEQVACGNIGGTSLSGTLAMAVLSYLWLWVWVALFTVVWRSL